MTEYTHLLIQILSKVPLRPRCEEEDTGWRRQFLLRDMVDDLYSYLSQWNRVQIMTLLRLYPSWRSPHFFDEFLTTSEQKNVPFPSIPTLGHWMMEKVLRFVHARHVFRRFFSLVRKNIAGCLTVLIFVE